MSSPSQDSQQPSSTAAQRQGISGAAPLTASHRFRLKSIGTKLFIPVMASAVVGVGGMAFLIDGAIKQQTEGRIQQTLQDRVSVLDSRLNQAESFARTLGTSALTVNVRQVESAETYRRLIFELFKNRPEFVVGLGVGQGPNGLLPDQQWFFAHYYLDSGASDGSGILLSSPYNEIRYVDGAQADTFYPESSRYQNYFSSQQDAWAAADEASGNPTTTYYSQIVTDQNVWLGTAFVEVGDAMFENVADVPLIGDRGVFALVNETGQIIAQSTTAGDSGSGGTVESIPGLQAVWSRMTEPSGLMAGGNGYWVYERIPDSDWVAVAFVPNAAIAGGTRWILIGGAVGTSLLLAVAVGLVARSFRRRLQPIWEECNRIATPDAEMLTLQNRQDEIERIATAFFNAVEHIRWQEAQMRQEFVRNAQTAERSKQLAIAEQTSQTLRTDVDHILDVVSAIESGNLTVEVGDTSEMTALATEALNRLIDRLGRVLAIVVNATQGVSQGAEHLQHLAVAVLNNAQQQTYSVREVQDLMRKVDTLAQDATAQVVATQDAVQLTQSATQQGQGGVLTIFDGIGSLQQSTDQINKRIQTLTSYVELATQFAKDQKRIASMTRILAVNASMLANRAAVQQDPEQFASITREFETVAAQVNDLAAQTNQSLIVLQQRTDQIQTTVSGLDHDVQEISQHVDGFTTGVSQSRQVFDTIQAASEQVAQTGQRVSEVSQAIAQAAQAALHSVQSIVAIATETSGQASMTREQAQQMEQLARILLRTVDFFKLQPAHLQSSSVYESTGLRPYPAVGDTTNSATVMTTATPPDR
jgi:twitching motility protein PilJ